MGFASLGGKFKGSFFGGQGSDQNSSRSGSFTDKKASGKDKNNMGDSGAG